MRLADLEQVVEMSAARANLLIAKSCMSAEDLVEVCVNDDVTVVLPKDVLHTVIQFEINKIDKRLRYLGVEL